MMFNLLRKTSVNWLSIARKSTAIEVSRFGLILDADGVITRGRELLPGSREALQMLIDVDGNFKIPTVFLTNATNTMRSTKAARLSEITGVHIKTNQVIMAHSPLRLFTRFHEKPVLISGQGPTREIAFALGFRDVTTIEDLRILLPQLDVVDSRRRAAQLFAPKDHGFKPIEAILLLGEPLNWESALQLIVDTLITRGLADMKGVSNNSSQIPVIACNPDLFWMGEGGLSLPRFGHGIFLECLEKIYQRIANKEMRFHAVLGKPTEVTYLHAANCVDAQAALMGLPPTETIYVIGDNTESDIVGANLFDCHLQTGENGRFDQLDLCRISNEFQSKNKRSRSLKHFNSVLIETGEKVEISQKTHLLQSVSRMRKKLTLSELESYKKPSFKEADLQSAIQMISRRENYNLSR